jgi:DNA-binding MarR family transcriptional regulator
MAREKFRVEVAQVTAALRGLAVSVDRLDEVAARIFGLNRTDLRALEILSRFGRLAPTELAGELGFTTGGVTTVLDRLETTGYVRREKDKSDRRRLVVKVTDLTRQREQEVFGEIMVRLTAELVKNHSIAEVIAITGFLERTAELATEYAVKLAEETSIEREE